MKKSLVFLAVVSSLSSLISGCSDCVAKLPDYKGISTWQIYNFANGVTNGIMSFYKTRDGNVHVTYNSKWATDPESKLVSIKIVEDGTVAIIPKKFPDKAIRVDGNGHVITQDGILGNQEHFTLEHFGFDDQGFEKVCLKSHSNRKYLAFQPEGWGDCSNPLSAHQDHKWERQILVLNPVSTSGKPQITLQVSR